jgi:hypothetical protein
MRTPGVAAVLALLVAANAHAQKSPPGFDEAYNKGTDFFNLGKYEDAWQQFARARDLDPSKPGPHRWLGRTARAQKRWRECADSSTQALRLNPTSSFAATIREDVDACRAALGRPAYDGKIPDGQGALAVIANLEGAAVTVDGIKKGATPLEPIPLIPGRHVVHLERRGYLAVDVEVDVVETIVIDVEVDLAEDPNAPLDDRIDQPPVADIKVGWLAIRIDVPGAAILIDGKPAAQRPDGTIEHDPGIHTLEVTMPGYEPWRRRAVVVRGQKRAIEVTLKKTADRRRERRLAYLGFGVAAALGVGGAVFGFLENQAFEEAQDIAALERERPPTAVLGPDMPEHVVHTRAELDDAVARGERYRLISYVSFGAAAVALGISIYYFIQERADERPGHELPMALVPTVDEDGHAGAQVVFTRELDW